MPDHPVCGEYATLTRKIIIALYWYYAVTMTIILALIIAWPCLKHELLMPMILPGANLNSIKGISICIAYKIFIAGFGALIVCQAEVLIMFIFVNMPMVSSIITHGIRQLEIDIKNEIKTNVKPKIRTVLIDLILLHRKYKQCVFDLNYKQ